MTNSTSNISPHPDCSSENPNDLPGDICNACPHSHACREVWSEPNRGPFNSTGLILSSIAAFLLPLFSASIGGGIAKTLTTSRPWLYGGTLIGLAVGILMAWLLTPIILKKHSKTPHSSQSPQSNTPPN